MMIATDENPMEKIAQLVLIPEESDPFAAGWHCLQFIPPFC